ncbi:MAG: kelch repeat-containing protein [Candidatus Rokuibacteriota bacterium]
MTVTGIMDAVHVVGATGAVTYPLPSPRADHRATLLPTGRVALTGGQAATGVADTVEVLDPISGVTATAPVRLTRAVSQHASALLPGGRLLVAGGRDAGGRPLRTVQELDLEQAHAAELIDLAETRAGHTATVLTTGDVLIAGGEGTSGFVATAEVWSGTGTTGASLVLADRLSEPRAGHTATLLPSGDVVIAGGVGRAGIASALLERFDPTRQTFHRQSTRLATARAYHAATLLRDGRVLVWGGVDAAGRILADGELYDPRTQAIDRVTDLAAVLAGGAASPALAESRPAAGATGVAVTTRIALRFNQALAVTSVTPGRVRLASPGGDVAIARVPVEAGLLLFVTPAAPLAPGTRYTLTLDGLRGTTGEALPVTTVAFTTAGAREQARGGGARDVTDPDEHDRDLGRDARTGRRTSRWQDLPALEAPHGVTAVAGQVLQLNGRPLPGVTLEIDGRRTRSDTTGRFLLRDLPEAGPQVLVIDGRTANRPGAAYGEFEVAVDVAQGRTSALGYTVWMPKIDWAHAVPIASPTTQETVISTPAMPGFEVRIPAGTVVYDRAGHVVRRISITPIPNDRPPFPTPAAGTFPTYFTVQPGGAILETNPAVAASGARIVYPNTAGHPPGVEADFWSYEPQGGVRWYRYGVGRVNDRGTEFEPGEGMRVHKFTMFALISPNLTRAVAAWWANLWAAAFGGDPVDLSTGLFVLNKTDLAIADVLPLALTRTYRPGDTVSRAFGLGANHNYGLFLYSENGFITISLVLAGGERVRYERTSSGTGYADAVLEHTDAPSPFHKSVLRYVGPYPGTWTITLRDGTVYRFTYNGDLASITDRFANAITLTRESIVVAGFPSAQPWGKIQRITGPSGRWIDLTYDAETRIVQATDHQGRAVGYVYDASGRLAKVIDAAGGVTEYTYDGSHRLLTIKDARGIVFLTNEYDANSRVTKQTQADATTYEFAYTLDGAGKVTQTDLTNPRGYVRRLTFSAAGYPLTDTHAHGQTPAQSGTNFILTATDALSRETALTYDGQGNVASVTRLAGTLDAVTTSFVHERPGTGTFNRLTSLTTPIATTTFAYNDPSRPITITQNTQGQVAWRRSCHVAQHRLVEGARVRRLDGLFSAAIAADTCRSGECPA